ncbi:MAG TPA: hypothetical protein VFW98_08560 [Gemmatimonadaceae bacterium]|nr:hypothetical protein [Gemmatimonadaceae bacterium]
MSPFQEPREVPISEIDVLPALDPPRDEVFSRLLERAARGELDVFHGAVPLSLITPFSRVYDPSSHPAGEAAIQTVMDDWRRGSYQHMWVYPANDRYVMSDDYIVWMAAVRGQPELVPCWILGQPTVPGVVGVQGPLEPGRVRQLLGLH